jgi:DDE superfamily endonuclease
MDESRLDLGRCTNQRVIRGSRLGQTYIKSPKTREWVTIIEVISATGHALYLIVIFKGKSVQTSWFYTKVDQDWLFTTSENG